MQGYGTFGGGWSGAYAVSADGSVVVGAATDSDDIYYPFRWTEETGMQRLGSLGGRLAAANAVSADGQIVVGSATDPAGVQHAIRWTVAGGLENLNLTYAALLTPGSRLLSVTDLSPDGRYLVGSGYNALTGRTEAFWLDTVPEPASGLLMAGGLLALLVRRPRRLLNRLLERGTASLALLLAVLLCPLSVHAQRLTWLGTLGGSQSQTVGVSADGTAVAGWSLTAERYRRAFRWTISSGMQDLGTLGGSESLAKAISDDGTTVVGVAHRTGNWSRAFRWTTTHGMQAIDPADRYGVAYGVSADGSVVVGMIQLPNLQRVAFRWTTVNGLQVLDADPGRASTAYDVSPDGSIVVGGVGIPNEERAFSWTQATGLQILSGALATANWALGVSADGTVIVGAWQPIWTQLRAFLWTPNQGMQDMGTLGGTEAIANDVSATGTTIVGTAYNASNWQCAFRWTAARGMENLNTVYAGLLGSGSELWGALGTSLDGRYIVGAGKNGATGRIEAFLLDTWRSGDANGDGCVDDADLLNVLFAFGSAGTGYTRHEDMDKNGVVDDADLLMVLFNFGNGC